MPMPADAEARKLALVEQVAADLGPSSCQGPDEAFLRNLYRNVAAEDVLSRSPGDLLAAGRSLWSFLQQRTPGRPGIRVLESAPWAGGRSVVEIINDDMPFLVDSVTAALNRLGATVHLVIHPVLSVERDPDGRLRSFGGGQKESAMQVELGIHADADLQEAITHELERVLEDVRVVVLDWEPMRRKVGQIVNALAGGRAPVPMAELTEATAYLDWLADNNFTFIGYREYAFSESGLAVVPGEGKGLLRNDSFLVFEGLRNFRRFAPEIEEFLRAPQLMMISKASVRSTVHRPTPLDAILVKRFDKSGSVVGQHLVIGLFTSSAYVQPPRQIPILRRKVARCLEQSGFPPASHDGKALQHILDSLPRDEMFQTEERELFPMALGILHLQERPRTALFARRDPFDRFASCLVYIPLERYSEEVRARAAELVADSLDGTIVVDATHLDEGFPLARLHLVVETPHGTGSADIPSLERELVETTRTWSDRLADALVEVHGELQGTALLRRFEHAFPAAYRERNTPGAAVSDIGSVLALEGGALLPLSLYQDAKDPPADLRVKTFHAGGPVPLSDMLPILENLGLRAINEIPFDCMPAGAAEPVSIQEYQVTPREGGAVDLAQVRGLFEEALPLIWRGTIENDGFNRLILRAGLSARQATVLRTYAKVMRQAGLTFSQAYLEDTLAGHPELARLLLGLFEARFDPALDDREIRTSTIEEAILEALDQVTVLDEDRILRSFFRLIEGTLRTNYFQREGEGRPKPYLSIKLASREIDLFPLPRPLVEIYVYSPRMEGCHLRGGKVARGGIRWSDRKEDFRTEILGLMKAQMVKNAVIVPVGSKGGFVVKRPPAARDRLMPEVVDCYKTLMCGLLDLTDNIKDDRIVPPPDVVRHDGDDPYLVVAADKGTATFSDIANGVAQAYGLWLGDAFASGGSVGYDHKAMGITARGAWEAIKRHFREIGTDIQTTDFSCVAVGDMSGDVFGNGMLLSRHIKLVAAFDHRHVFIDPDPDPAASWAERKRLFELPRSSWNDYDRAVLSPGGALYERSAKSVLLSPEARAALGLGAEPLTPAQLIRALLQQPVDLLWFGGIGTYVKATSESQADAGDRANDALRVDASTLRARVVGEGANLAVTQRARIEFALKGGRINTDAVDNSAGVDTSDHEVNIKIAVGNMIDSGRLAAADRASFLASLTDEVAHLVLEDNYLQTQALSVAEAEAGPRLDQHSRLIRNLERQGRLDRAIEFLPDEETLVQRAASKRGLTRPELAVLMAYAKNTLYEELLASDLPDAPEFRAELLQYFPAAMRELSPADLERHRLRREIIATHLANAIVNRAGIEFVIETETVTGRAAADVARAFRIATDIFELQSVWRSIEALDNKVPAGAQTRLLIEVRDVTERAVRWLLFSGASLAVAERVNQFAPGIGRLARMIPDLLPEGERAVYQQRKGPFVQRGVPEELANRVVALANLVLGLEIVRIDEETDIDLLDMGRLYYDVGERFGLDRMREICRALPTSTTWERLAVSAALEDFYLIQAGITRRAVAAGAGSVAERLQAWIGQRQASIARLQEMVGEISRSAHPDIAMLTVAARQLRTVI